MRVLGVREWKFCDGEAGRWVFWLDEVMTLDSRVGGCVVGGVAVP